MVTKEEKELIEARSHERGMAMTPVEELTLLGFYEGNRAAVMNCDNEIFEVELGGAYTTLNDIWEKINKEAESPSMEWNMNEEYEFDTNNEYYKPLDEVLRRNNDRRKYFA